MYTKIKNIAIVILLVVIAWLLVVACTRKAWAVDPQDEQAKALMDEIDYYKYLLEYEKQAWEDYRTKEVECWKALEELHNKWVYARAEQEIAKQKINELSGLTGFLQQSQLQ